MPSSSSAGIGLVAKRQHLVAHRIADEMDLASQAFRQPLDLGIGGGDRVDLAGHQPVDPAEHRILLVDQGRDAVALRREQRRERRIAAEADHRRGAEGLVEPRRHRAAGEDVARRPQPADRAAAQPPGREDMDLHALEQARDAGAAIVGDQGDFKIFTGRAMASRLYETFRPSAVIGFGGYPAFPALLAARATASRPCSTSRMRCSAGSTG